MSTPSWLSKLSLTGTRDASKESAQREFKFELMLNEMMGSLRLIEKASRKPDDGCSTAEETSGPVSLVAETRLARTSSPR